jgi:CheY-like chemotaxis protein
MTTELMEAPAVAEQDTAVGTVLVVDDSPVDAWVASVIVQAAGLEARRAQDGKEALEWIAAAEPALVLTDLRMPRLDGLGLVDQIGDRHPHIPVILMTSAGSQEIALEALRRGASGYVPKSVLAEQLPAMIGRVLAAAKADRRRKRFLEGLTRLDVELTLGNDEALIPVFIQHFQEHLMLLGLCDHKTRIRAGVALEEALINGMHHGNLELSSALKEQGKDTYHREAARRKALTPYSQRRVTVRVTMSPDEARFVIRDGGPGFDVSKVPDPTDPENLLKPSGRGLLMIRAFMDEVTHNDRGNEITLVRRPAQAAR